MPETAQPGGRSAQKRRTRRALVDAAALLVTEGIVPTVAQAAERADVSRATAYRYFPTQGSLLVHVSTPLEDLRRVLEQGDDEEGVHRGGMFVSGMAEISDEGLDADRMRHRQYWIDEALLPVRDRLTDEAYGRLFGALALFV